MNSTILLAGGLGALFVALAVALLAFALPASPRRSAVARSLALVERTSVHASLLPQEERPFSERVLVPLLARLAGTARSLSPVGYTEWIVRALDRAGNPPPWTLERMYGAKTMLLVVLGAGGFLLGVRLGGAALLLAPLAGAAAGFFLPDVLLYNAGLKRQDVIRKALAEAMDMLTVCVEAGLGFDAALAQVARKADGPLARELARALQEMQLGTGRLDALRALGERTTVPDLQSFVAAVVQADSLGIPIANILREQAQELRIKRRQRAEEQAQKVPIKILFPVLFFIFPALFIVVIGPGAISMLRAFTGM